MWKDPIIEELHRIREEHAAKFDNDLQAIAADLNAQERASGRLLVSFVDEARQAAQSKRTVDGTGVSIGGFDTAAHVKEELRESIQLPSIR
jgi:hypothetical protein